MTSRLGTGKRLTLFYSVEKLREQSLGESSRPPFGDLKRTRLGIRIHRETQRAMLIGESSRPPFADLRNEVRIHREIKRAMSRPPFADLRDEITVGSIEKLREQCPAHLLQT